MKISMEKKSEAERKLNIEVPWERFRDEISQQLMRIRKGATLKGFRKGKAPMELVRRIYSDDARQDAVNSLASEAVRSALAEHDLKPFGNPYLTDVKSDDNQPLTLEAVVELEPVFDPADYSALPLDKPLAEVSEDEVESFLRSMQERHGESAAVEESRGLRDEDIATLDFVGTLGGEAVKNLDVKDFMVRIGRSEMVPGFEEQIVGMKAGQTREFDLTFPEDFANRDIAGKMVHFTVTLKEIRELKVPDIDDEFARSVGKFETVAELKETIRGDILKMKEDDSVKELRRNLARTLVEDNVFDVPPSLVDQELRRLVQEYGENMLRAGMPNEKVREMILANEDHLKKTAVEQIKLLYIIGEIAEREGMKAGEQEVRAVVSRAAARTGRKVEEVMKEYAEDGTLSEIGFNIVREKVFDKLLKTAKIRDVKTAGEEPAVESRPAKKGKKGKK